MKKRLLLISNSYAYGSGYLDHCQDEIIDFLGGIRKILFIPYALNDKSSYVATVTARYKKMNIEVQSIHTAPDLRNAVRNSEAIFVGGGNTFRLLNELYKNDLIEALKKKIEGGTPFIGSSAGSNIACPTIKTTNDMPIIFPPSFDALNVVNFQINPHYFEPEPNSKHMGETRMQRIKEFQEENNATVVGLKEGAWIRVENQQILLKGRDGAKIFVKGKDPVEYSPIKELNSILS